MTPSRNRDQLLSFQSIVNDNRLFHELLNKIERWIPSKLATRYHHRVDVEELASEILMEALYGLETPTILESRFVSRCYAKMKYRVHDEVDHLQCQRRCGESNTVLFDEYYDPVDRHPLNDPQQSVQFRDTWDSIKSRLDSDQLKIVELRLNGKSNKYIAKTLGVHPSQITRKLRIIQQKYFPDEFKKSQNRNVQPRTENRERNFFE